MKKSLPLHSMLFTAFLLQLSIASLIIKDSRVIPTTAGGYYLFDEKVALVKNGEVHVFFEGGQASGKVFRAGVLMLDSDITGEGNDIYMISGYKVGAIRGWIDYKLHFLNISNDTVTLESSVDVPWGNSHITQHKIFLFEDNVLVFVRPGPLNRPINEPWKIFCYSRSGTMKYSKNPVYVVEGFGSSVFAVGEVLVLKTYGSNLLLLIDPSTGEILKQTPTLANSSIFVPPKLVDGKFIIMEFSGFVIRRYELLDNEFTVAEEFNSSFHSQFIATNLAERLIIYEEISQSVLVHYFEQNSDVFLVSISVNSQRVVRLDRPLVEGKMRIFSYGVNLWIFPEVVTQSLYNFKCFRQQFFRVMWFLQGSVVQMRLETISLLDNNLILDESKLDQHLLEKMIAKRQSDLKTVAVLLEESHQTLHDKRTSCQDHVRNWKKASFVPEFLQEMLDYEHELDLQLATIKENLASCELSSFEDQGWDYFTALNTSKIHALDASIARIPVTFSLQDDIKNCGLDVIVRRCQDGLQSRLQLLLDLPGSSLKSQLEHCLADLRNAALLLQIHADSPHLNLEENAIELLDTAFAKLQKSED